MVRDEMLAPVYISLCNVPQRTLLFNVLILLIFSAAYYKLAKWVCQSAKCKKLIYENRD